MSQVLHNFFLSFSVRKFFFVKFKVVNSLLKSPRDKISQILLELENDFILFSPKCFLVKVKSPNSIIKEYTSQNFDFRDKTSLNFATKMVHSIYIEFLLGMNID